MKKKWIGILCYRFLSEIKMELLVISACKYYKIWTDLLKYC